MDYYVEFKNVSVISKELSSASFSLTDDFEVKDLQQDSGHGI